MGIAHAIQSIGFLSDFGDSPYAYPVVMSIHLCCIALFGGAILMTNLRLLGLSFTSISITEMITNLRPWKRGGGVVMFGTGLLLATCQAEKYAPNPYFWTKMTILGLIGVHALVFRPLVYNRTLELDKARSIPPVAKTAAVLSIALWTAMFTMGRMIAYWEPPGSEDLIATPPVYLAAANPAAPPVSTPLVGTGGDFQ